MALRDRGVAMSTIMDALKNTLYTPGASTLRMHIAAISGGEPLSQVRREVGVQVLSLRSNEKSFLAEF
jgi:hypothetical protein